MARVRGVMAASISVSSIFSVSGRISTKTGLAAQRTTALAVETKVNEGMITSSPGAKSHSIAAISRAAVQEGVMSTLPIPNRSSISRQHFSVKKPSPLMFPSVTALAML